MCQMWPNRFCSPTKVSKNTGKINKIMTSWWHQPTWQTLVNLDHFPKLWGKKTPNKKKKQLKTQQESCTNPRNSRPLATLSTFHKCLWVNSSSPCYNEVANAAVLSMSSMPEAIDHLWRINQTNGALDNDFSVEFFKNSQIPLGFQFSRLVVFERKTPRSTGKSRQESQFGIHDECNGDVSRFGKKGPVVPIVLLIYWKLHPATWTWIPKNHALEQVTPLYPCHTVWLCMMQTALKAM